MFTGRPQVCILYAAIDRPFEGYVAPHHCRQRHELGLLDVGLFGGSGDDSSGSNGSGSGWDAGRGARGGTVTV